MSFDVREAADERRAVARLELRERRRVDDARDRLAHVVGMARIGGHDAVDRLARFLRRPRGLAGPRIVRPHVGVRDRLAHEPERVLVVDREMVGDARDARVHVGAAELFGGDDLARRRLHERRPAEKDRAGPRDDDRFVRHRRNVRAARRARTHHRGDLRNAGRRHAGLVVKDAAEVIAVGKHLRLQRQKRAARVDEIDARQMVLRRDLLRAQVFLDRHRIVGAALDGGVVGDDRAGRAVDRSDARHDSGRRRLIVVHAVRRQSGEFKKGRARIDEPVDAFACGEFAAFVVTFRCVRAAALAHAGQAFAQLRDQDGHSGGVAFG